MELTAKKITPCLWFDTQAEEALRFRVQEFEDRQGQPLWKRGIRGSRQEGGNGDDRGVRTRRAKIPGAERRPAFQVQRGRVVPGALRNAARDRPFLERAG